MNENAGEPVTIPLELRQKMANKVANSLLEVGHRVLAVSVSGRHCHAVVELPDHLPTMKSIVGDAKRASSKAVR